MNIQHYSKKYRSVPAYLIFLALAACSPTEKAIVIPTTNAPPEVIELSSAPIESPSKPQIKQAQASLNSLGYSVGTVDGIWGKRSVMAILQFEQDQRLSSAGGQLSLLNIDALTRLSETVSPLRKTNKQTTTPVSLPNQIDLTKPLSQAPQLIIIEQAYQLMAKANPFSAVVKQLEPGTGIYVISQQDTGWFEVETLDNERGFINTN